MADVMITEKPWGHERLLYISKKYVVKEIFVKEGHRLSLQYHRDKIEHMTLIDGYATLQRGFDDKRMINYSMSLNYPYYVPAGVIHRLVAHKDSIIVEVSTPELYDVIRLEDDYGR